MEEHIDPKWRKSSRSGNGGGSCVEVGVSADGALVRDTKQQGRADRTVLAFGADAWRRMLNEVKAR
jgi:hypothetical protein